MANSNTTVAHNWANQTGTNKNGSNFFYEGPLLYSYGYHFCVGAVLPIGVTVITNRSYSVSTAKHLRYAKDAVSHHNVISCAYPESALRGNHYRNFDAFKGQLREANNIGSLHKRYDAITSALTSVNRYVDALGLEAPEFIAEYQNILNLMVVDPKWHQESEAKRRREEKKYAKELEKLQDFRDGKISYLSTPTQYLRLSGENVCTSLGVCIPLREFRMWYVALRRKDKLVGQKVDGKFTILSVSDTIVKVGCHTIPVSEIESIANQINNQ